MVQIKLHLLDVFIPRDQPIGNAVTQIWNMLKLVPGVLPVEGRLSSFHLIPFFSFLSSKPAWDRSVHHWLQRWVTHASLRWGLAWEAVCDAEWQLHESQHRWIIGFLSFLLVKIVVLLWVTLQAVAAFEGLKTPYLILVLRLLSTHSLFIFRWFYFLLWLWGH